MGDSLFSFEFSVYGQSGLLIDIFHVHTIRGDLRKPHLSVAINNKVAEVWGAKWAVISDEKKDYAHSIRSERISTRPEFRDHTSTARIRFQANVNMGDNKFLVEFGGLPIIIDPVSRKVLLWDLERIVFYEADRIQEFQFKAIPRPRMITGLHLVENPQQTQKQIR
jgi:hypothetical protein